MTIKTNIKIIVAFLSIIIIVLAQLAINHKMQSNILDNTRQLNDVEAPLGLLAESSRSFDAETTETLFSALLYSQKNDSASVEKYKSLYDQLEVEATAIIDNRTAYVLLGQSQRSQSEKDTTTALLDHIFSANTELTKIETLAWEAINNGDPATAYSLLISDNYKNYKTEAYNNIRAWISIESRTTSTIGSNILKDSQMVIYNNLMHTIIIILILFITLKIVHSFVLSVAPKRGQ